MHNQGHERQGLSRETPHPSGRVVYVPFSCGEIDRMMLSRLERLPEIRAELVRSLRRAIREKRYYVPEERIAEGIMKRRVPSRLN